MAERGAVGVEKENVLIAAGDCSLTLLPQFGGKIASIRVKGKELLQGPLAAAAPRTRTMAFDASDASGWDECLPSVAACRVETKAGVADVPDHGDLWRVEWQIREQGIGNREQSAGCGDGRSVTLRGECFSLPLSLERTVTLSEIERGWRLQCAYALTNTGRVAAPWSWAAHTLFAAAAGDTIELPAAVTSLRLEGSGGNRLGGNGDAVQWPVAELSYGGRTDLSVAQAARSRIGDKLFAGPLAQADSWCALRRPGAGVRIKVSFDAKATPYLGLWICYGGWPDRAGTKQQCVAMEPSTAPVDSLAETGPWSRVLEPGECFSWPMDIEIEPIER
jgi:galactose mutarotase-like enzyme